MVIELITLDGHWKRDVVERCFNNEEAQVILRLPISRFRCPNRLIWHYTRNRMYSIKSGYKVAMERNGELGRKGKGQSSEGHIKDPIWLDVWQLQVPPKPRHFIWKGCKNILAVCSKLQHRGVRLETCCPHYGDDVETQVHLFFKCSFTRIFWFGSPLQLDVVSVEGGDFL